MQELIEQGKFYYHSALRILPPPPISFLNEKGEIVIEYSPFYLEIKKSFTDEHLLQYYLMRFNMKLDIVHKKRFLGGINHLVQTYGIDEILFTIDFYSDLVTTDNVYPPRIPLDIERYVAEGIETLERKKAIEQREGINCVVPKPR
jgi:hypothetical protein